MVTRQRAELRHELELSLAISHHDAHELRQPDANVLSVRHHHVAERLEVGAKRSQLGHEADGGELAIGIHGSSGNGTGSARSI